MIELHALTEDEFSSFSRHSITTYANDMLESGSWSTRTAISDANDLFRRLLPNGQQTPGHYFFSIRAKGKDEPIGHCWIFIEENRRSAFIYDLHISPRHRKQGHATGALLAIDSFARTHAVSVLRLHVFGHNRAAISLYDKLGFTANHIAMYKKL